MAEEPQSIIFQESPIFWLGSNKFINVPVVLMYRDTPLIEVGRFEEAGYTTQISIYHPDGTYLAKVKGSRLFATSDGEKSGLQLRHPDKMTICELNGKTLFEIRRLEAAALKTTAELHTPDGLFIKVSEENAMANLLADTDHLGYPVGQALMVLKDLTIVGGSLGIHYIDQDNLVIGTGGRVTQDWNESTPIPTYQGMPCVALKMGPKLGQEENSGSSNIRISHMRPLSMVVIEGLASHLDQLLNTIEEKSGPFAFFALDEIDEATGKCQILLSASWISSDEENMMEQLQRYFKQQLTPFEWLLIRDYTLADHSDPAIASRQSLVAKHVKSFPSLMTLPGSSATQPVYSLVLRSAKPGQQ